MITFTSNLCLAVGEKTKKTGCLVVSSGIEPSILRLVVFFLKRPTDSGSATPVTPLGPGDMAGLGLSDS